MEEFDIDIVYRPGRWHGNVDGPTIAYEGVGDVLEDDDFPDAQSWPLMQKKHLKNIRKSFNI